MLTALATGVLIAGIFILIGCQAIPPMPARGKLEEARIYGEFSRVKEGDALKDVIQRLGAPDAERLSKTKYARRIVGYMTYYQLNTIESNRLDLEVYFHLDGTCAYKEVFDDPDTDRQIFSN